MTPKEAVTILNEGSPMEYTVTVFIAPRQAAEIASLIESLEADKANLEYLNGKLNKKAIALKNERELLQKQLQAKQDRIAELE